MKKIIAEFKKFIMRGNVADMAVGVIVGSAFTAIVNGMSDFILKPIINWLLILIFGANSLSDVYTILQPAYNEAGELELANSVYIDWGSFINTIINFFLVATVLFVFLRIVNEVKEARQELHESIKKQILTKEDKKILKKQGIKLTDRDKIEAYLEEKHQKKKMKDEEEKKKAEEKARLEREKNPTTEDLLKQIVQILKESEN